MGRVQELLTGKDGKTRCVRSLRPDRTEGVYAIKLLYPLELSITPTTDCSLSETVQGEVRVRAPRRVAAERCLQRLRDSN